MRTVFSVESLKIYLHFTVWHTCKIHYECRTGYLTSEQSERVRYLVLLHLNWSFLSGANSGSQLCFTDVHFHHIVLKSLRLQLSDNLFNYANCSFRWGVRNLPPLYSMTYLPNSLWVSNRISDEWAKRTIEISCSTAPRLFISLRSKFWFSINLYRRSFSQHCTKIIAVTVIRLFV